MFYNIFKSQTFTIITFRKKEKGLCDILYVTHYEKKILGLEGKSDKKLDRYWLLLREGNIIIHYDIE